MLTSGEGNHNFASHQLGDEIIANRIVSMSVTDNLHFLLLTSPHSILFPLITGQNHRG